MCGLLDALGQPNIIFDSAGGKVYDQQWYPNILAKKVTDKEIKSCIGIYVSEEFGPLKPKRCLQKDFPNLHLHTKVCPTIEEKALNLQKSLYHNETAE